MLTHGTHLVPITPCELAVLLPPIHAGKARHQDGGQFSEITCSEDSSTALSAGLDTGMQVFERDDAGGDDNKFVVTMTEAANIWGFAMRWAFYRIHPVRSSPPLRSSVIFIHIIQKEMGFMRMQHMLRHGRGYVEYRSFWSDSGGFGRRASWWGLLAGGAGQQPGRFWDTRFPSHLAGMMGEYAGPGNGRNWHNLTGCGNSLAGENISINFFFPSEGMCTLCIFIHNPT